MVNAPKPVCHSNLSGTIPLSFIHFDALDLISRTRSETAQSGLKPTSRWIWSGIPFIAIGFCFLLEIIPLIYLYISSFHAWEIRFVLPFTAKTMWTYNWV